MHGQIVGRDQELEAIAGALERPAGLQALVIEGDAGLGKTTLWQWALDDARRRGIAPLVARPSESEALLPFAALGDLMEPLVDDATSPLAAEQRSLLRARVGLGGASEPLDRLVTSRVTLAALRAVAERGPVVVAIDDMQWLDAPSAGALEFAFRRLAELPILLLITQRPAVGAASAATLRAVAPDAVIRLLLGVLSRDDLDEVIRERFDLRLPRPRLVELHRVSGGNPLYALEIARALATGGASRNADEIGGPLQLPSSLGELLRQRLATLDEPARDAVLLTAALSQPTASAVESAAGSHHGLEGAIAAGVLELEGDRLRFAHPLLAAAAYDGAPPWRQREAHARLAHAAATIEERARHLALATQRPDPAIAEVLAKAAPQAANRGAPELAAELADHAARLTPAHDADLRRDRLAAAARLHVAAGDPERARGILRDLVAAMDAGPERAGVLAELADAVGDDMAESIALAQQALDEAGADPVLRSQIHTGLGVYTWLAGDLEGSVRHCRSAAAAADESGDPLLRATSIAELSHAEAVLGLRTSETDLATALDLERQIDAELSAGAASPFATYLRPSFQLGIIRLYQDDLAAARTPLLAELDRARTSGDMAAKAGVLFRVTELELRAGRWTAAAALAREARSLALQAGIEQEQSVLLISHAAVMAHLGSLGEAERDARAAVDLAVRSGDRMVRLRALGVMGMVELSRGSPEAALAHLQQASKELRAIGVGALSQYRVIENEIEALIELGRLDEADRSIAYVEEKGIATAGLWHHTVAARGRALLAGALGRPAEAERAAADALAAAEALAQPFELGRTLLVVGAVGRRARNRAVARDAYQRALVIFDLLGAPLWSEQAMVGLARIPGRRPAGDRLSDTERRVAELAAAGRSNKEIAGSLFITVRTVEANLTKAYQKLGIRSRGELGPRFAADLEVRD